MEHISVNGEKYVKASSIARELGYTADYVGQLCRGGKVDAQLVGRSWFVSERSIRDHKKDRYRSTARKTKKAVEKTLHESKQNSSGFTDKNTTVSNLKKPPRPHYESDNHDLIPKIPERAREEGFIVQPDEVLEDITGSKEAVEPDSPKPKVEKEPVQNIPVRVIDKPVPVHRPQQREMSRKKIDQQGSNQIKTEETTETGTLFMGIFVLVIVFILSAALVGLEAHVMIREGIMSSSYELNFSTVIDALVSLIN